MKSMKLSAQLLVLAAGAGMNCIAGILPMYSARQTESRS